MLFTVLPLIAHFGLPASFTASPLALAPQTSLALQALHQRVRLLNFTAVIALRIPEFRQAAGNYRETQRMEGKWAREDAAINRLAEKLVPERRGKLPRNLRRGSNADLNFELCIRIFIHEAHCNNYIIVIET